MAIGKLTATTRGQTIRFDLVPGVPSTLGRGERCTVRVDDPKVSRQHCRLELQGGTIVVQDLGSSHGLVHRGKPCTECELAIGDGFHVGETYVRFEGCSNEVAPSPLPAAASAPLPAPRAAIAPAQTAIEDADEFDGDPDNLVAPMTDPAEPPTFADEYPDVSGRGRRARTSRRQRGSQRGGGALVRLFGQFCLVVVSVITCLAVLLALKNHNPDWDVYRLLEYLRPRR